MDARVRDKGALRADLHGFPDKSSLAATPKRERDRVCGFGQASQTRVFLRWEYCGRLGGNCMQRRQQIPRGKGRRVEGSSWHGRRSCFCGWWLGGAMERVEAAWRGGRVPDL
uniref:Uncharacterized protein n=1 Tax=mine drainage metagenome TaxID=410659 RepID=E6QN81_9ZZZZ